MLNAHNELYKFADCLNININNKPIPSKHFNTTIVYSCGKMKRKKKQLKAPQTRRFDTFERFDGIVQTVVSIHFKTLETLFELGF